MKIICKKTNLIKTLGIVSRAISPSSTLGITKGILIKSEGDMKVSLSATDIKIAITTEMGAIVNEHGSVVIEAKLFSDIIRKLPDEDIVLSTDEKNLLSIKTERTDNEIQGVEESEFPRMENAEEEKIIKIDKEALTTMIEGTCFAASTDESRGIITGALFEIKDGEIEMAALDGYRVAIRREYRETLKEEEKRAVIPAKMFREAGKILLETEGEEAEIEFSENRVTLYTEDTTIKINLLNGEYIKYKDVIPKEKETTVKVQKDELLNAVELAEIYKSDGKNSFVRFSISDDKMIVSSRAEIGRGKETVSIEKEGEDLEIGFDARFLKEALRACDGKDILMEFGTSISPCQLKPEKGDSFTYLILPVRLSTVNI